MDFKDQVDFDFLREDNQDDVKLYEEVRNMSDSGMLNYFGFDAPGYERSKNRASSWDVNPYAALLRNHRGPIKRNYKLEKIYFDVLAIYEKQLSKLLTKKSPHERELSNLLIKLYALEENKSKKKFQQIMKLLKYRRRCTKNWHIALRPKVLLQFVKPKS